ncbi:MAG: ABC transporter ATP-binding protein [Blastopirellula sp.]|nr:MAG: ABC transporter ATP-binding protein [Blastopirellula sp.]
MALVSLRNISLAFHSTPLFDGANFQLEDNERVCLIGRNGAGKSTLMGILAGRQDYDAGEVILQPGIVIAELSQTVPTGEEGTVEDIVARGLGEAGKQLAEYHELLIKLAEDNDPKIAARIDEIQHALDISDGWNVQGLVDTILSKTKLDGDLKFDDLSAGMKRRVLLAQAMACQPQVLLLDEPTNHLDIESIIWLEEFLQTFAGTILFVTHDRAFARKVATRIADIDRGKLTSWACDYDTYLVRKEAALEAEEKQDALFDKKLAIEETWIRQGIKARRTRNEGRVRDLKKLREVHQDRRSKVGSVKLEVHDAERSGQLVIKASEIQHAFPDMNIVDEFSTTIMRGEKIGIVGPNGIGKTTLLKILLGELKPNQGTVRTGSNVQVAYFDQLHTRLDQTQTLRENIGDGNEQITINGRSKHVVGYLQEFLFTSEQANRAIKYLSGGEKNRLLLARLFAKPSNMLVLDEPTNDLDADTMELLENMLMEYQGTLIVISHDREFLDNVATSTIAFEGNATVRQYDGGYSDWVAQRKRVADSVTSSPAKGSKTSSTTSETSSQEAQKQAKSRKLNYKEKRELESLPVLIEELETEQGSIQLQMGDPGFYQKPANEIKTVSQRLDEIGTKLNDTIERWEELEEISGG